MKTYLRTKEILYTFLVPKNKRQLFLEIITLHYLFLITFFASILKGAILLFLIYFLPIILFVIGFLIIGSSGVKVKFEVKFLIILLIGIILFFVGVSKNNFIQDIISNFLFFISPVLTFYLLNSILSNNQDKIWAINNFIILSIFQVFLFFSLKIFNILFYDVPFVIYKAYNVGGLQSAFLVTTFLLSMRKEYIKKYKLFFRIILFLLVINEILVPVSLPFKQLFILLIIWFLYISYNYLSRKIVFLLIVVISSYLIYNWQNLYILSRFIISYTELFQDSLFREKRFTEIFGVLRTIKDGLPFSLIYGEGFGGLWDTSLLRIDNIYLQTIDFRMRNKVSMVHSSFFTLLIRGGLLALFCYLILLSDIIRKLRRNLKYYKYLYSYKSYLTAFGFFLLITLVGSLFDWFIYGNYYWGVICSFSLLNYKVN